MPVLPVSQAFLGNGSRDGLLTVAASSAYHRRMLYSQEASHLATGIGISRSLLTALRPKQWTKNLLIFLAVFFTINEAWDPGDLQDLFSVLGRATLAVLIFSVLSGAIYLVNDLVDIDRDRFHRKKRLRPIASGRLPIQVARSSAVLLGLGGLAGAFALEGSFGWVALGYILTMLSYSFVLKRIVVLDVLSISAGFVLRAVAGAAVLDVPISSWLYICTGLGALFIALSKRRCELVDAGDGAADQRSTLAQYTPHLLDRLIAAVAVGAAVAYVLYTVTASNLPDNHAMLLTVPFVLVGLVRYVYLVQVKHIGEAPEELLTSDVPLIASVALWLAVTATVLVAFRG